MDFDLFELDDDDEILSSVCLEPTQHQTGLLTNDVIPEFNCSGEDSTNSQFSTEGFIKNGFLGQDQQATTLRKNKAAEEIALGAYEFQAEQLHGRSAMQYVFNDACINMQYLAASVRGPIAALEELSYYQHRRKVTQLLQLLLHTTHTEQWDLLRGHSASLRRLLNRITEADTWKLVYFANSSKGNECNVPSYHLLHGVLEWKWLDLCILQKYDIENKTVANSDGAPLTGSPFECQLERIFDDLITCSLHLFVKKRSTDLLFSSPFPCTCFKEFWLLLQLALQKWSIPAVVAGEEKLNFWSLFNKTMNKVKTKMDCFSLNTLTFCEFANWMVHALTRLHGYRSNGHYEGPNYVRATCGSAENYEFCENCTQQFLNSNPSEEQLRIFICLLMPTLLQWWGPKVNIPMMLWEHFHKRLNASFYISSAAPCQLAVACTSGSAYLKKYRALLVREQPDANLTSYTLFTLLLGKSLQRLMNAHSGHQTQKLLGRIYTKFSLQKFLALNETGIHHLIELFLVLALCGDFNDLAPKLRDKLLSIAFEKVTTNKQTAVAKGHMALLILFAEHRCDLSEYVTKLLQQLFAVRHDLAVSKIIADGLLDVMVHADDFRRGEHLLIDTWLPNLLNNCTPAEQDRTLEALHLIFVKLQGSDLYVESNANILKSLHAFILPFLKQQYVTNFSAWMPQLAADFCTQTCASSDTAPQSFQKLFAYFSEAQPANRQALPQFLLKILESDKGPLVDATIVMQVWLKSLVLLTAQNEEVANLTRLVVQLPLFKSMTDLDADDILKAKEPLCVFVAAVGKNYDACTDYRKRCQIADNFNAYLRYFEKWIQTDLKSEKSELSFRFYSFLAIVIYNCPQIVYVKSKITCFFHMAITRFVLPTSIQMGKPPDAKLAQLIHKIWPVLVQGIGRLNFKTDPYINKTLNDLIQKWTPHFKISPNSKVVARPFIACLQGDNYDLSLFVCEKLTSMFLSTQRRQADPNACLVVTIFQELVDAAIQPTTDETSVRRLETFMKGTCLLTLEHIMMVDEIVPSRGLLIELFRRLIGSAVFRSSSQLKELLAEHLRILTKKHLAYYTFFYFELITLFVHISYELVEQIMEFLLAEVRIVEQKRGAGEDNRIRGCLQKLQQNIATAKQKTRM